MSSTSYNTVSLWLNLYSGSCLCTYMFGLLARGAFHQTTLTLGQVAQEVSVSQTTFKGQSGCVTALFPITVLVGLAVTDTSRATM